LQIASAGRRAETGTKGRVLVATTDSQSGVAVANGTTGVRGARTWQAVKVVRKDLSNTSEQ